MSASIRIPAHETPQYPRVLAAVLNWCAETDSANCVTSLVASDWPALEILIIDNASPDDSGNRLAQRFPEHHFLQTGKNLGYAGGNALACDWALAAHYDFVLVINDDAEVERDCVRLLVNAMQAYPRAAAASPTVVHHGTNRIWYAGGTFNRFKAMGIHTNAGEAAEQHMTESGLQRDPVSVSFLSGCVLLLRCEAIRTHGSFRPEFFAYMEDLELSVRFSAAAMDLLYVRDALASHKVPYPLPPDGPFAIQQRDVNRRRLIALHYPGLSKLVPLAWFYPTRLLHLLRFAARGDWSRCRAIWSGAFARIS